VATLPGSLFSTRKRLLSEDRATGAHDGEGERQEPPRKKRYLSTSSYIFRTLFNDGVDSDITVIALNESWKLHRHYLKQSKYFEALFDWDSRNEPQSPQRDIIHLDIPDEKINRAALNIAFGSLYCDDVNVKPQHAVNVLAAASLLQHHTLIKYLSVVMTSFINVGFVYQYYQAAIVYGLPDLERQCLEWYQFNLMQRRPQHAKCRMLRDIDPTLMQRIIKNPNFAVLQIEMDVYNLLLMWLFLKFNPDWVPPVNDSHTKLDEDAFHQEQMRFFATKCKVDSSLLESLDSKYLAVFKYVRLGDIMTTFISAKRLETDNVLPQAWISEEYRAQTLKILRTENGHDYGPSEKMCRLLTEHDQSSVSRNAIYQIVNRHWPLYRNIMRCGRELNQGVSFCWRWTGFNFGIDLIMTYSHKKQNITIMRNCKEQQVVTSVSLVAKRSIICKVKVFKLKESGMLDTVHSSGWKYLDFSPDQEKTIIQLGGGVGGAQRVQRQTSTESVQSSSATPLTPQRDQRMFMVAYILQNDPPGDESYYLPERYCINRGVSDVTLAASTIDSHSDSYNTLHGEANSVQ